MHVSSFRVIRFWIVGLVGRESGDMMEIFVVELDVLVSSVLIMVHVFDFIVERLENFIIEVGLNAVVFFGTSSVDIWNCVVGESVVAETDLTTSVKYHSLRSYNEEIVVIVGDTCLASVYRVKVPLVVDHSALEGIQLVNAWDWLT